MIWSILKRNWKIVLIIILVLALTASVKFSINNRSRYLREKNNVSALLTEIEHSKTIHNEDVTTIEELQLTVKELRRFREEDMQTIKELQVRPPQIKEVVKTVVQTEIEYRDTLSKIAPDCFKWNYNTKWWALQGTIYLSSNKPIVEFIGHTTDSISHYLYKVPKCKIFGIRFGVDHYEIKCINHNPNSKIIYNEWINVSRTKKKRIRN